MVLGIKNALNTYMDRKITCLKGHAIWQRLEAPILFFSLHIAGFTSQLLFLEPALFNQGQHFFVIYFFPQPATFTTNLRGSTGWKQKRVRKTSLGKFTDNAIIRRDLQCDGEMHWLWIRPLSLLFSLIIFRKESVGENAIFYAVLAQIFKNKKISVSGCIWQQTPSTCHLRDLRWAISFSGSQFPHQWSIYYDSWCMVSFNKWQLL